MNDDEARRLATRIIDTWPSGAHAYIWRDTLTPLDHHAADVTYRQLVANAVTPPTPGAYLVAYRQTVIRLTAPPPLFEPDAELIGRDEYLRRHPPTTITERQHWTKARQ